MTAEQIMNNDARWATWGRTARDCYWAIRPVTDYADGWESRVLIDGALDAEGIMEEAMK